MNTTSAGNFAEDAVARELAKQGYKIVGQNWRTKFAEIDVIAQKDKTMYLVEVKYRKTLTAGDGFDYITPTKLHHMQRAAEAWVSMHDWQGEYILLAASAIGEFDNKLEIDIREI